MIDQCGAYLGEGFRRVVYQHKQNPNHVIKFLKKLEDPHNKIEYWNWLNFKDTEKGIWLAPCISISDDSQYLVQEKVELFDTAPDDIPEWLKVLRDYEVGGNNSKSWGVYKNHSVIIDYGDQVL
jgi:hypothetical protein